MKRHTPTVWVVWGGGQARAELNGTTEGKPIVVDSASWFEWLAAETTHGFAYALFDRQAGYVRGFLTVRKERRARGELLGRVSARPGPALETLSWIGEPVDLRRVGNDWRSRVSSACWQYQGRRCVRPTNQIATNTAGALRPRSMGDGSWAVLPTIDLSSIAERTWAFTADY